MRLILVSYSDSNIIEKTKNIETSFVHENKAKRSKNCSLKNAVNANINGKLFCFAYIGRMKHEDALVSCQNLNATLPLPRNLKEHYQFVETLKRLKIVQKMNDFSTKIILDIRRVSGRVSFF